MYHKLLQRQLQKYPEGARLHKECAGFLKLISDSYEHYDKDRLALERCIDITSEEMIELNNDLRQESEQVKKAHSLLQNLFDKINEAFFTVSFPDFKTRLMSPACERIYGYPPEEFYKNSNLWYEVVLEEDKAIVDSNYKVMYAGKSFTQEYRIQHKDGSIKWLESLITPTLDPEGNILQIDGVTSDITERKEAEAALVKANEHMKVTVERLNEAQEIAQLGHWTRNLRTDKMVCSPQYYEIFESSPEAFPAGFDGYLRFFGPEEREAAAARLKKVLQDHKPYHYESRIVLLSGSEKYIQSRVRCVEDENGELIKIIGTTQDITKQKKNEIELERQRKFMENILESMRDPIWVVDGNLRLVTGNSTLYQQLELTLGKKIIPGENILIGELSKEKKQLWRTHYETALSGQQVQFDFTEHVDGKEHTIRAVIYPITNSGEKTEYLVCNITDVTNYLRLKKENEEALKRYELISKVTNDALWQWNPIDNTVKWGAGMKASFGYDVNDTSLEWWNERVHPEDRERVLKSLNSFIEEGQPYWKEQYRFSTINGEYKQVIDNGYALRDGRGEMYNVVGAIQDIHELLTNQEEIAKLSMVASKTTNGVMITDKDVRIEWVNEAFTKLTGYTLEEVEGRVPGDFLEGERTDRKTVERMHKKLSNQESVSVELVNYAKDGRPFWVEMSITPVVEDGKTVRYIAIESDITARKEYVDLIERKNKMLQNIALVTAHELRHSVANIMGLGDLMERSVDKEELLEDLVPRLVYSTRDMDKGLRVLVDTIHKSELDIVSAV